MSIFFAVILTTVLTRTALSASILHKEIEIGHNGVLYKVAVDAEEHGHGNIHHLTESEEDHHQHKLGNIGIHYEIPHTEHTHHQDEDEKHHGVVLHIELGADHDSWEHHKEDHDTEHHGLKHHGVNKLKYPEIGHGSEHHGYDDTEHNLHFHESPYHLKQHESGLHDLEYILEHSHLGHQSDEESNQHETEGESEHYETEVPHHHKMAGHYRHGPQKWASHELGNSYTHTGQTGKHILGNQNGKLWHLFYWKTNEPTHTQFQNGVSHSDLESDENEHDELQQQSIVEALHPKHHTDFHH